MAMIGDKLTHYEITAEIGKGGMGEVYQAKDTKLGRDVAVKVLPEEFALDKDRVARFQREAKLLASLNHPNIAAIYGLEESEGTHFLVMELIEGETLKDRLKSGPIPVEEALKLALQMAEALEAAHENGVIHRDLKPANIKVTPDGKVKVLDFGLSKAYVGDQDKINLADSPTISAAATQQGVILGTAAYMSPEQARGKSVDKRADIWAFGSVLYEIFTGRPAFEGEDVSEILASVIKGATDLNLLPSNLDRRIRDVIERCLQKDTHQRFRDIGDVRYELNRVLTHPEWPHRNQDLMTSVPHRRRMGVAVVAALALSAACTGFAVWFLTLPEPQAPVRLVAVPEGEQRIGNGYDPDVILSPDGRRLLFLSGSSSMASVSDLFIRDLDSLRPRLLTDSARAPFFSPDGNWVGFVESNTKLKKVSVDGGPSLSIADISTFSPPRGLTWSADDTIIFATRSVETGLLMVSAEGGTIDVLTTPDAARGESDHLWPEILPGGKAVLFTITNNESIDSAQIAVLDLETKEYDVLIQAGSNPRYAATGHIVYGVQGTLRVVAFDPDERKVHGTPTPIIEGVVTKPTGAASFSISHTGSLAYLAGTASVNPERRVAWFDQSGQTEVLDLPPDTYSWPKLSKDGSKLAIVTSVDGNDAIWTYDLGGGTDRRRFTLEGSNTVPIWSPDGETIAFASDREGIPGIWLKNADGRGVAERLTTAEEGTVHWPESWSPDGETLAFTIRHTPGGQLSLSFDDINIWTLSLATGETKPFSTRPFPWREDGPEFSPDGRWLVYEASEDVSGLEWNVYVEPFPPMGERWQLTQENSGYACWSSPTELTYRPLFIGAGLESLRTMNVSTQPGISSRGEREWPIKGFLNLDYTNMYDVAQDGRFLVVTVSDAGKDEGSPGQINIVLNWFEELKERVPVD
jgi:serine/threonine protein kinase